MKYFENLNYFKYIMIGFMLLELVYFIFIIFLVLIELNSIFFFNLRGKLKFVFYFGVIVIIILV